MLAVQSGRKTILKFSDNLHLTLDSNYQFMSLGISYEPRHFMGESCIDLILTDHPNIFIESSVHSSLQKVCHHQIIYSKISIDNLVPFQNT